MSTALRPPERASAIADNGSRPPLWLDRLCLGAAAAVLATGIAALALGAFGLLHAATVVPASAALFALSLPAQRSLRAATATSGRRGTSGSSAGQTAGLLAVAICIAAGTWASVAPGSPVLVDRDPASYATTAKWLSEGNSLWVRDPLEAFGEGHRIQAESTAVFGVGDDLEFQFLHLPAAVPAATATLAGDWAIFLTNGLVAAAGLLAVYSVAVRVTRRQLLSLAVPCALAVSMPFVAVSRDVFSEPFSLLFIWTALWLICEVVERPGDIRAAAAAGVFAGATVLARVDSILFLVVLAVVATAWVVAADGRLRLERRRAVRAGAIAATSMLVLALVDLAVASSTYMRILDMRLWSPLVLLAVTAAGCLVAVARADWVRSRITPLRERRHTIAWVCAALLGAGVLGLWFLRPALTAAPEDPGVLGATDAWAFEWMQWYLGVPTVALAVVAMVVATHRFVMGTLRPALVPLLALLVGAGALYWWRPSIRPDHIWATRRFLPVILPALIVMACVAAAWLVGRVAGTRVRPLVAALAFAALVVPPALTTSAGPLLARQRGVVHVVEETCALLDADVARRSEGAAAEAAEPPGEPAVLVVGAIDRLVLPQALRSWCGVPVATTAAEDGLVEPAELDALVSDVADRGHRLYLVSSDPEALGTVLDTGVTEQTSPALQTRTIVSRRRLEVTFERTPQRYMDDDERLLLGSRYSLGVVAVPGGSR